MLRWLCIFPLTLGLAMPARAACIHNGELYAKTTLEQEFSESVWVVRASVTAAKPVACPEPGTGFVCGQIYTLQNETGFKGEMPAQFSFLTEQDSGAFYMDVGASYLLFLVPQPDPGPAEASGSVRVNYACGQSREWGAVSADEVEKLYSLQSQAG